MIGNAPRSDINPALAAGINAVYVPHAQTWRLEHQELQPVAGAHCLPSSALRSYERTFNARYALKVRARMLT